MSQAEENARAIAYQASLKRRDAAQKAFKARLQGSQSAFKDLLRKWKPILWRDK